MTARSLFSPAWYRVAALRPRLRPHAQLHRQHYRGDLWYILQDHTSGKFYRFTPTAQAVIGLMDGRRTVQQIWDHVGERLGDDLPSQEEVIQLLSQLHAANMLTAESMPDVAEIADRSATLRRRKMWQRVRSPLGIRIPLIDPDRFLGATYPLVAPLFGWFGLVLWLGIVAYGLLLAGIHWSALTENVVDRVMSAQNLTLLFITYPFVKALHELGHGYAVKRWGGEVHEMGIMLMVFMPIPYVEASAASAFQQKSRRALVGAAGVMVEMLLAALAVIVWVAIEPGLVRAMAFNVMLIGGVSTLLFNGNPLLRFDGYYVFSDLIEVPNLAMRASRYMSYLMRHYLFGVGHASSPATAKGEWAWLFGYAVLATSYRMAIMIGIMLFVATKFFFVGVLVALWGIVMMFGLPVAKMVGYLFTSPELSELRPRAFAVSAALVVAVVGPAVFVPLPYGTIVEGVVAVPERSHVFAATSGFVAEMPSEPGRAVAQGQTLLVMENPLLSARADVLEAGLREQALRVSALEIVDRVQADIARERQRQAAASLSWANEQIAALSVVSPGDGRFYTRAGDELIGRYLNKGELVGYVLEPDGWFLQVVVQQDDIDLVHSRTEAVSVRFSDLPLKVYDARVVRATPQATTMLPSTALGSMGGGQVLLDPSDQSGRRSLKGVFVFDLAVTDPPQEIFFGGRIIARFDHGAQSAAMQIYRAARQLFLRRFDL